MAFKKLLLRLLLIIIIGLFLYGLYGIFIVKRVYSLSVGAKTELENLVEDFKKRDLTSALGRSKLAQANLMEAHNQWSRLTLFYWLPSVSTQMQAVNDLLRAGIHGAAALGHVSRLGDELISQTPLKDPQIAYASLTEDDKKRILQKLIDAKQDLQDIQKEADTAIEILESIPYSRLYPPLKSRIAPIGNRVPSLKKISSHLFPLLEIAPTLLGYPNSVSYLWLLQNNHELRPTGGFIGTYSFLKMHNGGIKTYITDNVYNLDEQGKRRVQMRPPAPIQKYLGRREWLLRDSNWSPDFPTSAKQALWFYQAEKGGKPEPIDAVIAITPEVIERFLALVGPITVDNIEFTKENLHDRLEVYVSKEFQRYGIPERQRKAIIGKLGNELFARIFRLPTLGWIDVAAIGVDAVDEKQALIAFTDPSHPVWHLMRERNWDGALIRAPGDYLMVVDANLGSLKSDGVVEREISYQITEESNGDFKATATVVYNHRGTFTWKTTRLRTYTRLYVPLGSQLISAEGLMENDRTDKKGRPDIYEEFNKTVFGGFIAIEPGQKGTLKFVYKLPSYIGDLIRQNRYQLYVQKQPGTLAHPLEIQIQLNRRIKDWIGEGELEQLKDKVYLLKTDLKIDRELEINF
ncbi:MAG: DUF4012 domain-containing protein [Parcubacteria group bacterium]|nr:DUF4012 domain-containing protein [Parcubacteria group bacterium]